MTLVRAYCLNIAGKRDLTETVKGLAEDQCVRALIVTSSHPQAWLVDVAKLANMTPVEARAFSEAGHVLVDALSNLSFPTIAAVNSPVLGGGRELAMACDLLYAGKDAQFGQIECLGGVIPGFGGTWRLVQRVGMSRAMEMIFTAEVLSADQAREINLVLEVVPGERLLDHCRDIATKIRSTGRSAVSSAKRLLLNAAGKALSEVKDAEQKAFAALFGPEQQARMKAFLARAGK